jgi:ABC-type uncharacterized transport system ATPase subunit
VLSGKRLNPGTLFALQFHPGITAIEFCQSICLINHGRGVVEGESNQIKANYGQTHVQIKYQGDARTVAGLTVLGAPICRIGVLIYGNGATLPEILKWLK